MSTPVFRTRRGRIMLSDETLIYEHRYERLWRVSHWVRTVARVDVLEIHFVTHVHWFAPAWIEVIVRHGGGVLNLLHEESRTAEALRKRCGRR